jgi:hypothetical protein
MFLFYFLTTKVISLRKNTDIGFILDCGFMYCLYFVSICIDLDAFAVLK